MTDTATAPETTEAPAATERKKRTLQPCFCRSFEVGVDIGTDENPDVTIETTGCTQMTHRVFAQGHDAKLVSFLVRGELDGKDIRSGRDSGLVTTHAGAVAAAGLASPDLAAKAATMLRTGQRKADAKAASAAKREAAKQAKAEKGAERAAALQARLDAKKDNGEPAGEQATPVIPEAHVKAKVGRWEYAGTENPDGTFTYISSTNGEAKVVPAGKWTRIPE